MDLVVDANILFAALIKDSVNCHFLFDEKFHFFTPEFILTEFEKHKEEILDKTERSTEDFYHLLEVLKRRISIISLNQLTEFLEKAEKISPDPADVIYFALALKLNCAIWSHDKKLKQQDKVKVYSTYELIKL